MYTFTRNNAIRHGMTTFDDVAGEFVHGYITFPHIWRWMKILNTAHIYSANTALGLTNS